MEEELLVLVDSNDKQIGLEEKLKCHLPEGKLHRAFTILLFNEEGKLLLTKRSQKKMLWPNDWDGTAASHPRESETYVRSAQRRLPEEIGLSCDLEYLFKFEYHVLYKNIGSENEICGTLIGIVNNNSKINFIEDEISEIKWISINEILEELKKTPQKYCPWMILAIHLLTHTPNPIIEKHKSILTNWINGSNHNNLKESVKYHFPDNNWKLINS